ncbi:accessory factor UbiK family protein [Salinisphaera sp. P385]|uniref:Ubiquinone biosynthesis accessory factor UbiK n=1 Tax=Spectribacter acetivorans TaxID=3075603 RepID=A0ABU3B7A9_9GAMM|nr:accessory factor UbiK family protein [Salinisphaera sp. P385]MDT0618342.1 accessory factor UbiK family protein [Salinisphaera sp. P385]
MIDARRLEELAQRLAGVMPPALGPIRTEIEQNLRAVLQSQLPRLELVGREEFEAARSQLNRARERITELETRVAELEAQRRG